MYYKDFLPYAGTSDGIVGNACEMCFKSYTSGRKVTKVRPAGKQDAYVTFEVDGKRGKVTVEVKTACGRVDHCCNSQYIAYWPEPDEDTPLEHSMVVFTREQFSDLLNGVGYWRSGKTIRVSGGETHIQSFRGLLSGRRPKASKPLAEYIYMMCEDKPTVAEWLEALRK